MKLPKWLQYERDRKWWDVRDWVFIYWFIGFGLLGLLGKHWIGGFGSGLNFGFAIERLTSRATRRRFDAIRAQDRIDLRTMSEIAGKMSYDMLHQIEKKGLN